MSINNTKYSFKTFKLTQITAFFSLDISEEGKKLAVLKRRAKSNKSIIVAQQTFHFEV